MGAWPFSIRALCNAESSESSMLFYYQLKLDLVSSRVHRVGYMKISELGSGPSVNATHLRPWLYSIRSGLRCPAHCAAFLLLPPLLFSIHSFSHAVGYSNPQSLSTLLLLLTTLPSSRIRMASKDADPTLGFLTKKDTEVKLPRPTRVKNKTPAPIQITAEQILREARERQESEIRPPKQKITDRTELDDYRLRKRKEFEDLIRRVRWNTSVWVKYAQWEESQKDYARTRSVWERALEVDYRNHTLWLKYAEFEMKNKFINHARNVWDRAVQLLPRVDQLWYKYIHMEEMIGNVAGARQIFERWMGWMPDQQGWLSYIKFELRYNEVDRARAVFERFVQCHPKVASWIRLAKFEMKNGEVARARAIYERAVELMVDDEEAEQLFVAFAWFEERCKETERARCIYKYALDHIPKGRAEDLYRKFVAFEKQYGDREGIEDAIVGKRRFQYEDEVRKNPLNYDAWFDYIRLEESVGDKEKTREVYERAIANVPPAEEKRYWQPSKCKESNANLNDIGFGLFRINYALFEELDANDIERTRAVYSLNFDSNYLEVPDNSLWVPQCDIVRFGAAQLMSHDFRLLQLEFAPKSKGVIIRANCYSWYQRGTPAVGVVRRRTRWKLVGLECLNIIPHKKFSFAKIWLLAAQFEIRQKNLKGARKILGTAIGIAPKDKIFKKYIEIELQLGNIDRCRTLYEKYLEWAPANCYAWSKFAELERSLSETERARAIFELAIAQPALDMPELLWKAYIDFEISEGEYERTRQLYERLLDRTKHLKVWISYAKFEASAEEDGMNPEAQENNGQDHEKKLQQLQLSRGVFERAFDYFRTTAPELKEERAMLLEEWLNMESEFGYVGDVSIVQKKLPRKVKRKRAIASEDGSAAGYEEYYDYIFPDEAAGAPTLKILEAAYKWKKQKPSSDED
ncbi:Crooked neck-like protein 1 [Asimina triloba]